ncbi:MAG: ribonuclease catalytic domain-containing protein [Desulfovibrionaceae bacterium]
MSNYFFPLVLKRGMLVEYIHSDKVVLGYIESEKNATTLQIYSVNKREVLIAKNRILPWVGPSYPAINTKAEIDQKLFEHLERRNIIKTTFAIEELWDCIVDDIKEASIQELADICEPNTSEDYKAALGAVLLQHKQYFRFSSSHFVILNREEHAQKILAETVEKSKRELLTNGRELFKNLWERGLKNMPPLTAEERSNITILAKIEEILHTRVIYPEDPHTQSLWKELTLGLVDSPLLPVVLSQLLGIIPQHHNSMLERIGYDTEHTAFSKEDISSIIAYAKKQDIDECTFSFISIDSHTTKDIDDAFYVEQSIHGYSVTIALALPVLGWNFTSEYNEYTLRRASSLYLPEATYHMLPDTLGIDYFSLHAMKKKEALLLTIELDHSAQIISCIPSIKRICVQENLTYDFCENILALSQSSSVAPLLHTAYSIAKKLQENRINQGAVIIQKEEQKIVLKKENENLQVHIHTIEPTPCSQDLVSEFMILASSAIAGWAIEKNIPLIYRKQDVNLPKSVAGIWTKAEDIHNIVKLLGSASLSIEPKRHAGLGVCAYAPITSPLRRYIDFVNEAQIMHAILCEGCFFQKDILQNLLIQVQYYTEQTAQVQRYRPRYWKLLSIQQDPDKWRKAILVEENDHFVIFSLIKEQFSLRAKRNMVSEKILLGSECEIKLGKVNPLYNEITILEVKE